LLIGKMNIAVTRAALKRFPFDKFFYVPFYVNYVSMW